MLIHTQFKAMAILLLGLSAFAQAESRVEPPDMSDLSQSVAFDSVALSEDMLADQRGMAVTNTNNLDAYLYENSVVDAVTGGNLISEGSLANNAGLSTVIQNSGNNVLIQNALILNIQVQ